MIMFIGVPPLNTSNVITPPVELASHDVVPVDVAYGLVVLATVINGCPVWVKLAVVTVPGRAIWKLLRRSPAEAGFACVSVNTTVNQTPGTSVTVAEAAHASPPQVPEAV
jgi:hypothetical protein